LLNYETLKVSETEGVVKVTLNRPDKRNAMNPRMHEEANDLVQKLRDSSTARVVVITGAGDAFCAGMDLKEYFTDLKNDKVEFDRITRLAIEWRGRGLREIPQPTIALVNGFCVGGGLAIVDACDLAFAAQDAEFCVSEINFRFFPAGPVTKALADRLTSRDALFYSLTGKTFPATEAHRIGLVNGVLPRDQLENHVMEIAALIASKDPVAVRMTKESHYRSREMSWDAAMDYATAKTSQLLEMQRGSEGRTEGIKDFLGKRFRPGLEGHETVRKNTGEGS
jgi:trans-feruloyl-CoA hydratase/vanillin synthase